EHPGLHLAALDIARGNVVEDQIAADMAGCLLWGKMFAAFFQHDRQFQFVVQFLGEMLRINDGFVMSDDCVDILKEHNPRHYRMRESSLGGLFMMLAEVACGMEELAGNNRSFELDL